MPFTVIVLFASFVNSLFDAIVTLFWVIVPLFSKLLLNVIPPLPLITPSLSVAPLTTILPLFAISPALSNSVLTVIVLFALFVNTFVLSTCIVPCVIVVLFTTFALISVVPVPVIALANCPPVKLINPLFVIPFVINRLPAFTFTVPLPTVKSFCVTVLLKFTAPLPLTVVLPLAVAASAIVPLNVMLFPLAVVNVIVPSLYISFVSAPAVFPLNSTSLFDAFIFSVLLFHTAPPAVVAVLFVKLLSLNVTLPPLL